jgi:hypothetical protein
MKQTGTKLGDNFRLTVDGKVIRDEKAIAAKQDVSTRIQKRRSRRVKVVPPSERDFRP